MFESYLVLSFSPRSHGAAKEWTALISKHIEPALVRQKDADRR